MEDDSKVDLNECQDIARQLFENRPGRDFNVIMGGGMSRLVSDDEHESGKRKDGKDLTKNWIDLHPQGKFVTSRDELLNVNSNTEHLLGIFAKSHMQFNVDRNSTVEPSLAEMTLAALKVLKNKNSRGFLLMVEGAKIDLAHHYNNAFRALDETLSLDGAIAITIANIGKNFKFFAVFNFFKFKSFRPIRNPRDRNSRSRFSDDLFRFCDTKKLLGPRI